MYVISQFVYNKNLYPFNSWYHHNISRHVAEGLLMANGKDGSYLLRASATHVGEYSLSVR